MQSTLDNISSLIITPKVNNKKIKTTYYPNLIDPIEATNLFNYLKDNIEWIID